MQKIGKFGGVDTPQDCKYLHKPGTSSSGRKSEMTDKHKKSHSTLHYKEEEYDTILKLNEPENGVAND